MPNYGDNTVFMHNARRLIGSYSYTFLLDFPFKSQESNSFDSTVVKTSRKPKNVVKIFLISY